MQTISVKTIISTTLLKIERKGFFAQLFCLHAKPVHVRDLIPYERRITGKVSVIQCGKCGRPHLSDRHQPNRLLNSPRKGA